MPGTPRVCRVGAARVEWRAMPPLADAEITAALDALAGWAREGDEIVKTFDCGTFAGAIAFVVQVGFLAERADHHPDIDVRWRKVRIALTTHYGARADQPRSRSRGRDRRDRGLTCRSRSRSASSSCCSGSCSTRSRTSPGPGAPDVAIGYERAWDELNFGLLWDLSGAGAARRAAPRPVHRRQARGVRERRAARAAWPSASRSTRSWRATRARSWSRA